MADDIEEVMVECDWKPLIRAEQSLISTVRLDSLTQELVRPFDYQGTGTERFTPWLAPELGDFGLAVIVGASGSGKSTMLKTFGDPMSPDWHDDLPIAGHFADPVDASERLAAAGLSSVPDWCKPYQVLSTGQRFRADLARQIRTGAVIDEFTSVVDRHVAQAASVALARYVRRSGIRRMVLATVHRDVLEWLEPDIVIDTDRGQWTSGRCLRRPDLVLDIRSCEHSLWSVFAQHHYLSESINRSSHCYMATWNDLLVGFVAAIAYPSGTVRSAYREHRLVVLPDYQGLGIGPRLSEAVAQHYLDNGKRYFGKTAHPRIGEYRDRSPRWKPTSKNHMVRKDGIVGRGRWELNAHRWTYSHEFIGGS